MADVAQKVEQKKLWELWELHWMIEGPCCIQKMKHLVKTLYHCCFGDVRDCPWIHKELTREMINSLVNMDFKFL